MGNTILDFSTQLKKAIKVAAEYTVGLERDSYPVSGVLIGGDRVLTASHLVPDEGARIILPDGSKVEAKLAGRDTIHDLALLRLPSGSFKALSAAETEVGDLVLALRRDPFDGINAAFSMVSAKGSKLRLGRSGVIERYVQTGSDRMQGSTGGPLVDGQGAFCAVQVFNRRMGSEVAIPADLALERAALIEKTGSIQRPYLGIRSQKVELSRAARDALSGKQETGLLIMQIEDDSAAEKAGMEVGDILVEIAGSRVENHEELLSVLAEKGAGASVQALIVRGGKAQPLTIVIGGA